MSTQTQNMDVPTNGNDNQSSIHVVLKAHLDFQKLIQRGGFLFLGLGLLSLILGGPTNIVYAILMILVGLASFYIKSSPILFVYGVTMAWIVVNLFQQGNRNYFVFAIFGLYSIVRIFKQYRLFKEVEKVFFEFEKRTIPPNLSRSKRAENIFPVLGFIFGITSLIGISLLFMNATFLKEIFVQNPEMLEMTGIFYGFLGNLAVLGFATSTASWLAKFKQKTITIIGMIFNSIIVFILITVKFVLPLIR